MNLQEFQAKRIFARYGVPIPDGDVVETPAALGWQVGLSLSAPAWPRG